MSGFLSIHEHKLYVYDNRVLLMFIKGFIGSIQFFYEATLYFHTNLLPLLLVCALCCQC